MRQKGTDPTPLPDPARAPHTFNHVSLVRFNGEVLCRR